MPNFEDELDRNIKALAGKLKIFQEDNVVLFSYEAMVHFCGGFDIPIFGPLAYIQQNTQTHKDIECVISGDQIPICHVYDDESYQAFANSIVNITPKAMIDCSFILLNSIYPISDVSEKFSVYFSSNKYEIVYSYPNKQELRFEKDYLTYIEPKEVEELRNGIASGIIGQVSRKIDDLIANKK